MARKQVARRAVPRKAGRKPAPGGARQASGQAPGQGQPLGYADLISMVELIERASAFSEFRLKVGAIEIEFRRGTDGTARVPGNTQPTATASAAATGSPVNAAALPTAPAQPTAAGQAASLPPAGAPLPPGTIAITAPMVGTFYRAPAPGERPFVEPGQRVDAGTTLCIIEVMKLMNTVAAATAGTVVEIRARDATPVAHDEVLIVFRPEA